MLPTEFFPERPLLPWQQNSGQNGLKLGLHKKYRRYLRQMGVFELQTANCKLRLFGMGIAQLFESAHTHPRKNRTLNV